MSPWHRVRFILLLIAFAGTLAVLGKVLFAPAPLELPLPAVAFPARPALSDWEPAAATSSNPARYRRKRQGVTVELEMMFIPDLPVHYVGDPLLEQRFLPRGSLPLDAGMHYFANSAGMIIPNRSTDRPTAARVDAHAGDYGIWSADQRIHLSTIVTPNGSVAMSTRQVACSLYLDHPSLGKVWQWLLGSNTLSDRRCVLIHLSVPADGNTPDQVRRVLSESWAEWRGAHFPVFPARS